MNRTILCDGEFPGPLGPIVSEWSFDWLGPAAAQKVSNVPGGKSVENILLRSMSTNARSSPVLCLFLRHNLRCSPRLVGLKCSPQDLHGTVVFSQGILMGMGYNGYVQAKCTG